MSHPANGIFPFSNGWTSSLQSLRGLGLETCSSSVIWHMYRVAAEEAAGWHATAFSLASRSRAAPDGFPGTVSGVPTRRSHFSFQSNWHAAWHPP